MLENVRSQKRSPLSVEQVRFLENYLRSFDKQDAGDRAGLTADQVEMTLKNPVVAEIIEKEENFRFRRLTVSSSRTILHIAEIAYGESMVAEDQFESEARRVALQALPDRERLKALEILCKYQEQLGMGPMSDNKDEDLIDKVSTVDGATALMIKIQGVKK